MGNYQSISKINYEKINEVVYNISDKYLLLNTLNIDQQKCLIYNTLIYTEEEHMVNKYLTENKSIYIIIYGLNYCDETIYNKYIQLLKLGFDNVHIYPGGIFEWLLLQDIYGDDEFRTTSQIIDILKYRGNISDGLRTTD